MRKYHQKQLLDLIQTVYEANAHIKKYIDSKNFEGAIRLLIDCQESAVSMGTTIENLEGEGAPAVTHLEKFCDILYEIGASLDNNPDSNSAFKRIDSQLKIIENSIRNDIKADKIEVVFLPYKASMWDSMESVWLAAQEDPQCDTYVVPIPYYDVNPDNSSGRMHYEGDQFPDYVPITDWRKYNIQERHPDVIYIHNPYDELNTVTRVHPDYFSKTLKSYTDMLVYIPYFVSINHVSEELCLLPGTIYADKVIVQSEDDKKTYIKVFEEFEKKNNCRGLLGNYRDKFLALGSPKFDKVINSRREDYQLPQEWADLIEQQDGGRKKVVLYNTSIKCILKDNEQYIKKLKNVMSIFKERTDVVLLWRPHPLSIATYQRMRPALLQEYLNIVEKYRQEGWGIYDDSSDMNRAIAISDAYYGDGSSLVALYQCTGKPVIIQKTEVLSE
jgi:hypothetical protein